MTYMFFDLSVLVLIFITAIFLVHSKNLLNAIIFSSFFSVLCALLYLLMDAPDVALTEAAIGACVTTCFSLGVLKYLNEESHKVKIDISAILIFGIFACVLIFFSTDLHSYGLLDTVTNTGAVEYYKTKFGENTGLLSMVNAILASYRGFDTFGETLVIFVAGMCGVLILEKRNVIKDKE